MMKGKKTKYHCVFCDWVIVTHKLKYEGMKCPKCKGIIVGELVK